MRSASRHPPHFRPLFAAALAVLLPACGSDEPAQPAPRPVLVVVPGDAAAGVVAFAGEVRAREESPLSFRVGGNLLERRVDVGDQVE
ncbi:MAG: efflux RND transporter periplasmic adaptor subunit, partial [Pseudomonadota bacterium]|nr:efflux RND transporter periplasmic adaptor subunit [Pseudomonadota bacterium]